MLIRNSVPTVESTAAPSPVLPLIVPEAVHRSVRGMNRQARLYSVVHWIDEAGDVLQLTSDQEIRRQPALVAAASFTLPLHLGLWRSQVIAESGTTRSRSCRTLPASPPGRGCHVRDS